jgi:hypothetical protein
MEHRDGRRSERAAGGDNVPSAEPGSSGNRSADAAGREVAGQPVHPADRPPQRVRAGTVVAAAARAGCRYWLQILALAIPVSVVGAGVEIVVDHFVDPSDALLSVGTALGSTGVTLLGTVLLSGYVCRLVGAAEHGQGAMTFLRVARSLPWVRLVAADVLVAFAVVAGLVLFVVPGLAALTFLAVVGPIIEIEHRPVLSAARRSAQLTRRHLGSVLLLATIPLAAVAELEAIAPDPHRVSEIIAFLVVRGLAEGIAEACVAVILVELCFQLIEATPQS